ncbi:MAG: DUF3025 domain-containing protein [Pseudomonadota bacterium]
MANGLTPAGALTAASATATELAAAIDWNAPWLEPYRADGLAVCQGLVAGLSVAAALNALGASRSPVQFVDQSELPEGQAYEQFIFETRRCPTRENLHDLFNGLCWLRFPAVKSRLNALQAEQIRLDGVTTRRGPVRDALTVFDENAAFFIAPSHLCQALQERDWQRLFITQRSAWREARPVLFGHALLEKLVKPRKAVTAHVYLMAHALPQAETALHDSLHGLDAHVARDLEARRLASKPFVPLPVMGVPGWNSLNENFSFYDDSEVFRLRAGTASEK